MIFKNRSILLFFLISVTLTREVQSQWIPTNGPYGAVVHSLAVSGSYLFAGTQGTGVFVSADNGASWTAASKGLTNTNVWSLAVSGTNLFAGTENGGVFLSSDNGANWTSVSIGSTNSYVAALAVSGTNLFAGTYGGGVFVSENNGSSWNAVSSGLTNNNVVALAVIGTNIFAGTSGAGGGVFLSTNNGTSWKAVNSGLNLNSPLTALGVSGTNLFAGIQDRGIYLSSNNGTSWKSLDVGTFTIFSFTTGGGNIIAGGTSFLYSQNNGTSWNFPNAELSMGIIYSLVVNPYGLFAGTSGGVYYYKEAESRWISANRGITCGRVNALAVNGTMLFTGTESGGVFRSNDNGANWTPISGTLRNPGILSLLVSDNRLYIGTTGGVFVSNDNGNSWLMPPMYTMPNQGLTNGNVKALAVMGNKLIAGTEGGGIFYSTDYSMHWTETSSGLTNTNVRCLAVSGSYLFAGTRSGVFVSDNNGASWTGVGPANYVVNDMVVNGTDLFIATDGGGVYKSRVDGINWTPVNSGLTNLNVTTLTVSPNGAGGIYLFAGAGDRGVFMSANNGASWKTVNNGLTNLNVWSLAVNGTNLFAGTTKSFASKDGLVWSRSISEILTSTHNIIDIPEQITLLQNFPNPFSTSTAIHFQLPKESCVTLKIYDFLGRETAVLINRKLERGTYETTWIPKEATSGIYFCRLQVDNYIAVKKLILQR